MKKIIKRDGRKANFDERKIYDAIMQAFGSQNRNEPAKAEEITDVMISDNLDTAGIPDPDLMIRTSGEQRISNYLLWQLAYAEMYFTPVPWPDFNREEFKKAIENYQNRDRRFGLVKEDK